MKRFNDWLASKITDGVSTMWCAYAFMALALYGLPTALAPGGQGLVSWTAQTFIQLVLLSIIMVGQKLQSKSTETKHAEMMAHVSKIHKHLGIKK